MENSIIGKLSRNAINSLKIFIYRIATKPTNHGYTIIDSKKSHKKLLSEKIVSIVLSMPNCDS